MLFFLAWVLSLAAFFFPNGLTVGQEAHSEHKIILFDLILKVNHRSLALPSLEGAKYQSSSPGNP